MREWIGYQKAGGMEASRSAVRMWQPVANAAFGFFYEGQCQVYAALGGAIMNPKRHAEGCEW